MADIQWFGARHSCAFEFLEDCTASIEARVCLLTPIGQLLGISQWAREVYWSDEFRGVANRCRHVIGLR